MKAAFMGFLAVTALGFASLKTVITETCRMWNRRRRVNNPELELVGLAA
jgi:hypothetical protein